jgi:hypothetical protein
MFLTGFIFGSIIVYLICLQEKLMPVYGNAGKVLRPHEGAKLTVYWKQCWTVSTTFFTLHHR